MKPYIRYPGAKWLLADWIASQLPEHKQYLEPFCGSAAIFLNKEPADHEIINDLNGDIVNLFRVLRSNSLELIEQINLTPWSREEYNNSYQPADSEIERARRFLVRCWQAHGTRLNGKTGWRHRGPSSGGATASLWRQLPDRLAATIDRLKNAEIECMPALEIIKAYPDFLLYVDPPYELSTRQGKMYSYELTTKDHETLLAVLLQHRGPVVLSGYAHELYDSTLAGWHRVTMPALAEHGKQAQEVLWLNPQACKSRQLSFDFEIA
jgi:DNA adenine methylase